MRGDEVDIEIMKIMRRWDKTRIAFTVIECTKWFKFPKKLCHSRVLASINNFEVLKLKLFIPMKMVDLNGLSKRAWANSSKK